MEQAEINTHRRFHDVTNDPFFVIHPANKIGAVTDVMVAVQSAT
jgi:hypothetical protein